MPYGTLSIGENGYKSTAYDTGVHVPFPHPVEVFRGSLYSFRSITYGRNLPMSVSVWQRCLDRLQTNLTPQEFNTWVRPLQAVEKSGTLYLFTPNSFVRDWVDEHLFDQISGLLTRFEGHNCSVVVVEVGTYTDTETAVPSLDYRSTASVSQSPSALHACGLRNNFTFDNFIAGKSNQIARAAAIQVAENSSSTYNNPLFIYGGVGLGKTHLMHAIGNHILAHNPEANVICLHSERFVADMVTALQHNKISEFKSFYRSVEVLLIDDIQFFAGKERSQEEFFHTFNALHEQQQLVVLTCDRYPKEVEGLEERLQSRFGSGLPVEIDPPEMETRSAILIKKAKMAGVDMPNEVAFFIAQKIRSNVRELEGAMRRVIASAYFTKRQISIELAKEALRDLLAIQYRLVTIDNIMKTVATYYKIRVSDMVSKKRTRPIVRPRQIAMALAKEFTNRSLPEIGDAFGGRDHTTVIHACRKVAELRSKDIQLDEDYSILLRMLGT